MLLILIVFCAFFSCGYTTLTAIKCCPEGELLQKNAYQCEVTTDFFKKENTWLVESLLDFNYVFDNNTVSLPFCATEEIFLSRSLSTLSNKKHYLKLFNALCFDTTTDNDIVLVGCLSRQHLPLMPFKKPLVRKCCRVGERVKSPLIPCERTNSSFNIDFYDFSNLSRPLNLSVTDADIIFPGCKDKHLVRGNLLTTGELYVEPEDNSHKNNPINVDNYCLDTIPISDETQLFLCFPGKEPESVDTQRHLNGIGMIISISFLTATFLLYLADKKKRVPFGQFVMCHIASFTVAFICLARNLFIPIDPTEEKTMCEVTGYTTYFSFIAGFLWQNVMCIDLWSTFRAIQSRDQRKEKQMMRFVAYSFYAWGSAIMLTALVIFLSKYNVTPESGLINCWLSRLNYDYYIFFVGPIGVIIVVNTILYIMTARHCYLVQSDIRKRLKSNDVTARKNNFFKAKEQLSLSAKLFVLMGLTWSLEIISYLLMGKAPSYVFFLSDMMNSLYGLFIFIILVLRKKMVREASRSLSTTWVRLKGQSSKYHSRNLGNNQQSIDNTVTLFSSTVATDYDDTSL